MDSAGNLYIADTNSSRIRKVSNAVHPSGVLENEDHDQQFLMNVAATAHIQPVHATGVELMGEVALDPLPAARLQVLAPLA